MISFPVKVYSLESVGDEEHESIGFHGFTHRHIRDIRQNPCSARATVDFYSHPCYTFIDKATVVNLLGLFPPRWKTSPKPRKGNEA